MDGTKILTHFPPAGLEKELFLVFALNSIFYFLKKDTYCSDVSVNDVLMSATNYKEKERSNESMLVFGYGDGGGGPSIPMLEHLERMKNVHGLPKVEVRDPNEFFDILEKDSKQLLTWVGELYFEFHRGTYTTQANVKKHNRACEFLLREVEAIHSFLLVHARDKLDYPHNKLNELWELVLLNQFHDVLPGTSIGLGNFS